MSADSIKTFDIIWIDDQFSNLYPLIRPLVDQGFTYYGLETYFEVVENLELIRASRLIILDMIIPPGSVEELPLGEKFLGLAALSFLRGQGIQVPVIVYTVVRDEQVLAGLLQRDPLVIKAFQKGGKFQSTEFASLARDTILKRPKA